jgi:hypothetical protein
MLPYTVFSGLLRYARNDRHCEERSDEAIQKGAIFNCVIYNNVFRSIILFKGGRYGDINGQRRNKAISGIKEVTSKTRIGKQWLLT